MAEQVGAWDTEFLDRSHHHIKMVRLPAHICMCIDVIHLFICLSVYSQIEYWFVFVFISVPTRQKCLASFDELATGFEA